MYRFWFFSCFSFCPALDSFYCYVSRFSGLFFCCVYAALNPIQCIFGGGGGGLVAKLCLTVATPWTVACQAPLPRGFSRQEYLSGWPCFLPGHLPNPGIEPASPSAPALQADSLSLSHHGGLLSIEGPQISLPYLPWKNNYRAI